MADKTPVLTGEQIAAIRHRLGWTMQELGETLGYTGNYVRQHIYALERGRWPVTYPVAHLLLAIQAGYRPDTKRVSERAVRE